MTSWYQRSLRRIERHAGQVEGAAYGVPQQLHNGRKPSARRRRR